jgi:hypothetical protein
MRFNKVLLVNPRTTTEWRGIRPPSDWDILRRVPKEAILRTIFLIKRFHAELVGQFGTLKKNLGRGKEFYEAHETAFGESKWRNSQETLHTT